MKSTRCVMMLAVCVLVCSPCSELFARAPSDLSGVWRMNRDSSSPPGGGLSGGDRSGRGGGGQGRSGGGRRGGFGGMGGRQGRGGRGGGRGERASADALEQQRALMQEVVELPAQLNITQDGDRVTITEPDGVARTYLANGKSERHQLTNGTIETKTAWDGPSLRIEISMGSRAKVIRTLAVRQNPRQLEIATGFDGARKDARRIVVYDTAEK